MWSGNFKGVYLMKLISNKIKVPDSWWLNERVLIGSIELIIKYYKKD